MPTTNNLGCKRCKLGVVQCRACMPAAQPKLRKRKPQPAPVPQWQRIARNGPWLPVAGATTTAQVAGAVHNLYSTKPQRRTVQGPTKPAARPANPNMGTWL